MFPVLGLMLELNLIMPVLIPVLLLNLELVLVLIWSLLPVLALVLILIRPSSASGLVTCSPLSVCNLSIVCVVGLVSSS